MLTDKHPLKVFLCHAHGDKDKVRKLFLRLSKDGVDAWLDEEKLLPGMDWGLEIDRNIRDTDVIVICLSKEAVSKSGYVQKEIKRALDIADEKPDGTIFVIPARLDNCDVPDRLKRWQWVDLFIASGYEKLIRALQVCAVNTDKDLHFIELKAVIPEGPLQKTFNGIKPAQPDVPLCPNNTKNEPVQLSTVTETKVYKPPERVLNSEPLIEFPKRKVSVRKLFVVGLLALAVISVATYLLLAFAPSIFHYGNALESESPTAEPTATADLNYEPPTAESTATNDLNVDYDSKGVPLRLIPAGSFWMGNESGSSDEKPVHAVTLEAFYIDIYEVTNIRYKECVDMIVCPPPRHYNSSTRSGYYGNPDFDTFPVVYIDWFMAKTYCEWRGARLPTEAEWEKSARGIDGRIYPWGNETGDDYANFSSNDTLPIGQYQKGVSPYGIYDMAGNVSEWVSDWHFGTSYLTPLAEVDSGYFRVIRGGSWNSQSGSITSTHRDRYEPIASADFIGFRCARSVTNTSQSVPIETTISITSIYTSVPMMPTP